MGNLGTHLVLYNILNKYLECQNIILIGKYYRITKNIALYIIACLRHY